MTKTQAMRGSPYFKPFEKEVLGWESQLLRIEECIRVWQEVQKKWLYMESMFGVEEIVRPLQAESNLFKDVDKTWRGIMSSISKDPRVLVSAGEQGMLEQLKSSLEIIGVIDQGVNQFVEDKKTSFPRFFFLSNQDILNVVSETKDPTRVSPYCQKIFEGIESLEFNEIQEIHSIISPSNETVTFIYPVQPREAKGCVEKWLTELENHMFGTLTQLFLSAKDTLSNSKQTELLDEYPSQVILAVQHLLWTLDIQEAIKGGEQALKEQFVKLTNDVEYMIDFLQTNHLTEPLQICVKSMIIQQLYFKEVTEKVYRDRITSENDFLWSSQIRMLMVENELQVSVFNVTISYRYEYIGSVKRLVMTPQTHQGVICLAQAFQLNYYGSITGPCDVGKSSLGKELAAYIGTMYRVFSGSEMNTLSSISNFLCGVASSGCWGVLEDYDRANSEIMSYASVFLDNLQQTTLQKEKNLVLDNGKSLPIESGYFVLKTGHTSYLGRHKVPESLKSLFRPVTILAPDIKIILKTILISFGFKNVDSLAQSISDFQKVFNSQFNKKKQYQFGLRKIAEFLELSRTTLKKKTKVKEEEIVANALLECIVPTLQLSDTVVVKDILKTVMKMDKDLSETDLVSQAERAEKCAKYLDQGQAVIIVGPTYSGKTTILNLAAQRRNVKKKIIINPKSMEKSQLFGTQVGVDWQNGILSKKFRELYLENKENWIIFDGPMDHRWVENLNSSMDFKKLVYFDSGETVYIKSTTKIIFECSGLDNVTPATLSRCGIISVPGSCLPWKNIFDKWMRKIEQEAWIEGHDVLLRELFEWMLPPLLELLNSCKLAGQVVPNNLVQCSLDLFERILLDALVNLKERKYLRGWIQAAVVYGSIWSIGGCLLDQDERVKFDSGVREIIFGKSQGYPLPQSLNGKFDALPPVEGVIFDFVFDFKARGQWKHWNDVIKNTEIPDVYNVSNLLIPTIDSSRYVNILEASLKMNKPFLLLGPRGTGKSTYITDMLHNDLDLDVYDYHILNFTPNITSKFVYSSFISSLTKKSPRSYGSKTDKKFVMFLDNFGLPLPDEFGDQVPNEFIHLFLDHKKMFDFEEFNDYELKNTNIVCCANFRPGMNQELSSRTLRHFHAVSCTYPSDDSLQKIFSTKMNMFFKTRSFQPEASGVVAPLVQSSIYIHNQLRQNLLQIPSKPHYVFNVRDIAGVLQGCMLLPRELSDNKKLFTRLWVHEVLRVFNDKLVSPADTGILFENIKHCVKVIFRENFDSAFEHLGKVDGFVTEMNLRNLMFGNFIKEEEKQFYQEITSFEEFSKQTKQAINQHFEEMPKEKFNFDTFKYSMENLSKVCRMLSMENGNIILLGEAGTGRELTTRVASILKNALMYTPPIREDFSFQDWRNDFKNLLRNAGGLGKCCILFINPEMLDYDVYLNDVNTFLTSSDLPNLFSVEERYEITEQVHNFLKSSKGCESELSPAELFTKFKERCRANLHIIMKLSVGSKVLTIISRKYPRIVDSSTISIFQQWPDDALQKVAETFFEELVIDREERKALTGSVKEVYYEMLRLAEDINTTSTIKIDISPSSFLSCTRSYSRMFTSYLSSLTAKKKIYEDILLKYGWIKKEISSLEKDIADLQTQGETLDEDFDKLETQLESENGVLATLNADLLIEEERLQSEQKILDNVREICENEFKNVNEKINACIVYLKSCSPLELQQPCQLKKPSALLKRTMAALCLLLDINPDMIPDPSSKKKDAEEVPDYWGPGKRLLQTADFVSNLEMLEKEKVSEEKLSILRNDYVNSDFEPSALAKSSIVGETICKWVKLTEAYITIDEANQAKKDDLKEAEIKYEKAKQEYHLKKGKVEDQQDRIKEINQQMNENKEKKKELVEESSFMALKKQRGEELLEILQNENAWWGEEKEKQEKYLETLIGNILHLSSLLFYLSGFPETYRQDAQTKIENILFKWKLPFSNEDFRFSLILSETEVLQWELLGLPNIRYYITNALVMKVSPRWPLLLDPDNQTVHWLQKVQKKNGLVSINVNDHDLVEHLVDAVEKGYPLLIKNIKNTIDSSLNRLIRKEYFTEEGMEKVEIGTKIVQVNKNFRLIFSTESKAITFCPYFQIHLVLINCVSTKQGIEDNLRRMVVSRERTDIRQKTEYFVNRFCETSKILDQNRSNIIRVLLNTDGNILEHENACKEVQDNLVEIQSCLLRKTKLLAMQNDIEEINASYITIAKHGATLLNTIKKLEVLNPVYTFSFNWFLNLFQSSIENSNKSKVLTKRIRYLCDHLTFNCFVQVSQSVYIEDKDTFSFLLCVDLMLHRELISELEIRVLLERVKPTDLPNPCSLWLSDEKWNQVCKLEQLDCFKGIVQDFHDNDRKWKIIFDAVEPDDLPLHQPWNTRLTRLHKLIIIKILRPDKFLEIFESFISENLGYKFVEPMPNDLGRILSDSCPKMPILLLLAENRQPLEMVRKLRKVRHKDKTRGLNIFSLNTDQLKTICASVEHSLKDGSWVIIQNCQFSKEARINMEKIFILLSTSTDLNQDFRLWFTSDPVSTLGSLVPGNCSKFVIEAAKDMKDTLLNVLQQTFLTKELFETGTPGKEISYSKLLFSLLFLVIKFNGRNFYPRQGWSLKTLFNMVDAEFAMHSLRNVIRMFEGINFPAFIHLIKECNLKHRTQDNQDLEMLNVLIDEVMNEDVLTVNRYKLSDSPHYHVPNKILFTDYIDAVKSWPQRTQFDAYNIRQINETENNCNLARKLLDKLLNAYRLKDKNKSCVISELKAHMKKLNDTLPTLKPSDRLARTLQEEVEAYTVIKDSLLIQVQELEDQIEGTSLLDPRLEELLMFLENYQVPPGWIEQADLGVQHSLEFVDTVFSNLRYLLQLDPSTGIQLGAILQPLRLFEAAKLDFCAKEEVPYHNVGVSTSIQENCSESKADTKTLLLRGLVLEYAEFNLKKESLEHCTEKSKHLIPSLTLHFYNKSECATPEGVDMYMCPVYITSNRVLSNGSSSLVLHLSIPSQVPSSELVKAGTAIIIRNNM